MKKLHILSITTALLLGGCGADNVLEDNGTEAQEINAATPLTTTIDDSTTIDIDGVTANVIDGTPVAVENYPWMTIIYQNYGNNGYNPMCGGSLISERWVLTAAHCVVKDDGITPMNPKYLFTAFGATDVFAENLEHIGVEQIIVHPDYLESSYHADIALVQLESAPGYDPIAIPSWKSTPEIGEKVTVVGYGLESFETGYPEELLEANMVVRTEKMSHPWYALDEYLFGDVKDDVLDYDGIVFAGDIAGGDQQACFGDSGGPLFVTRQDGVKVQAGIVSGGYGCGHGGVPAVYTKVAKFQSWIRSHMTPTYLYKGGSDEVVVTQEEDQADWINLEEDDRHTGKLAYGEMARFRITDTTRIKLRTNSGDPDLLVYDHWSMDRDDLVCTAYHAWGDEELYGEDFDSAGEWETCDLDSKGKYYARVISWDDETSYTIVKQ